MKNNKEIARMRMLAGLITEGQYKKLITEASTSNWESIDEYKSMLEDFFDTYKDVLKNPEEFKDEVYFNGDLMNTLAFDIAQKAGFKGDYDAFLNENRDFQGYCNALAQLFLLKHGAAIGVVDENDSEYKEYIQKAEKWIAYSKPKAQATINQLQNGGSTQTSFPGKKNNLIDYTFNITPDEIDEYGTYDDGVFEVESGDDSMADVYDEIYDSKATGMKWWKDDSIAPFLSEFYDYLLNKAVKEKYGDDTVVEYI